MIACTVQARRPWPSWKTWTACSTITSSQTLRHSPSYVRRLPSVRINCWKMPCFPGWLPAISEKRNLDSPLAHRHPGRWSASSMALVASGLGHDDCDNATPEETIIQCTSVELALRRVVHCLSGKMARCCQCQGWR